MDIDVDDNLKNPVSNESCKPSRHARDVFHAWMLKGAEYAGPLDMPVLQKVDAVPNRLVAFSDAMSHKWNDFDCWVHFSRMTASSSASGTTRKPTSRS